MTRKVHFRPQAEAEVLEARHWYEARRIRLGAEFGQAVAAIVSRITENPFAFPQVRGETRRAVVKRFPYAIYFRLIGNDILVLAVHGRQDPRRWQLRT